MDFVHIYCRASTYHNGTESRVLLPLRAERTGQSNATQKVCSEGAAGKGMPQRHRIAGFATVAERTGQGNATQKACSEGAAGKGMPQRHRIAGFAAVAER